MVKNKARNFVIHAQYIKDLSFENPKAPASFAGSKKKSDVNIQVNVTAHNIKEKDFEVVLIIKAEMITKEEHDYIVDLSYGGVFTIDVPAEELEQILLIYCPSILFPFARRILSDTTRDGGFAPLMLDPIDFADLYIKHRQPPQK